MIDRRQFLTGCATAALAIGCLPLTALAAREAAREIYPDLAPVPLPPGEYSMRILAVRLDEQDREIKMTSEWLDPITGQKAPFKHITMRMEVLND